MRRCYSLNLTLKDINSFTKERYIASFGDLFEHSSWIAEAAYHKRPFDSLEQMHDFMVKEVEQSDNNKKMTLLCHHPDLGSRLTMSQHSVNEQKGAGLGTLPAVEQQELSRDNDRYKGKFGFPFIIAVKGKTPEDIREALKERLEHTPEEEFQTSLEEVYLISWYRLTSWMEQNMTEERV
ncbi:2-oxo-4-hydroxy-4-carboxy-5-ureidoimidazoline decarboxylase [Paenibacillus sp. An7]|uniref:2-oxo-4-hydroxy-4-carboxy-5-ureidoimidazoline decarboxylase n=1 Tax=Paenibacillus sp. An7 TaxID=2689577 RepID=UPI002E27D0AA|nr:2-oxo-4-hydroxy-4-carboxy-5-ureidoimidazoline decarboxylase [Paenibacillus sp. An7]